MLQEKPFLILDDPFVSLDGQHLEKVKTLLKKLSKKMQITLTQIQLRLTESIRQSGMTQTELAKALNVSQQTIRELSCLI